MGNEGMSASGVPTLVISRAIAASVRDANGLSIWPPHPEPKP